MRQLILYEDRADHSPPLDISFNGKDEKVSSVVK